MFVCLLIGLIDEPSFIEPILDDKLKETFLKPWENVLCIHFRVCLSVYVCVRREMITVFELGVFLGWVILGTWERNAFFGFSKFKFYIFICIFLFFPYLTLVKMLFSSHWSQFFSYECDT